VHDAVVSLLDEVAWEEITIPLIADRSGVHQATLYRRWGTTSAILNDAVSARFASAAPVPDTGSLREDLLRYATMVAADMEKVLVPLVLRAAILEIRPGEPRQPSPAFLARIRELQAMLDRAARRGENPPTLDELLEVVVAPIYFRALFTTPMPVAESAHLVDRLLAIAACRAT
jgi:AcrR family transcriptional regulator